MSEEDCRLLGLAYRYASAGAWENIRDAAGIDAAVRAARQERIDAAETLEEAEAVLAEDQGETWGEVILSDAREYHRLLLLSHPDLTAGFPVPECPDRFPPPERALQCSAILAELVPRLRPTGGQLKTIQAEGVARKDVNGRMWAKLRECPESASWTARQFATELGCSSSSVVETPTWKGLQAVKAMQAAERSARQDQARLRPGGVTVKAIQDAERSAH